MYYQRITWVIRWVREHPLLFFAVLHAILFMAVSANLDGIHGLVGFGGLERFFTVKILDGQVPYSDFSCEYPPLALLSFLLPGLIAATQPAYGFLFALELLLLDLVVLFILWKLANRFKMRVWYVLGIYTLCLMAVGLVVTGRFDILPAALVLVALYAFISGKNKTAWAVLALGFTAKLYPIIIAPLFALYLLRQIKLNVKHFITSFVFALGLVLGLLGWVTDVYATSTGIILFVVCILITFILLIRWRIKPQHCRLVQGIAIFGGIVLVLNLPWIIINADGYWQFLSYHMERGLHAESSYGSMLLVGQTLGLTHVGGAMTYGSWNIVSPMADTLAKSSFYITASLLLPTYALYALQLWKKSNATGGGGIFSHGAAELMLRYSLLAVLIMLLTSKVFSPQFLIWLCPLVPLVRVRWRYIPWLLFLVAGAITQYIYPYHYMEFEYATLGSELGETYLIIMLAIRNFLLLAMAVIYLFPPRSSSVNKERGEGTADSLIPSGIV